MGAFSPYAPRSVSATSSPNASGIWTSTRMRSGIVLLRAASKESRSMAVVTVSPPASSTERVSSRTSGLSSMMRTLRRAGIAAPVVDEELERVEELLQHDRLVQEDVRARLERLATD